MNLKITLLVFVLVSAFQMKAQNLVINPDFEINTGCPATNLASDELSLATGWHGTRMNARYFDTCANTSSPGSGVPANDKGFQQAASGNAYAGVMAYKKGTLDRGYIYGTLSSPMLVGSVYKVRYKLSLADNSPLGVSNFGVELVSNTNGCVFNAACPFPYPVENIGSNNFIMDSVKNEMNDWIEVSMFLGASQPFQYIVFGVFDDVPLESGQVADGAEAFYYIDDVSVTLVEGMVFDDLIGCAIRTAQYNATCFEGNDASISALVLMVNEPYSIQWSPQPGAGQGTTWISGLSAGTYTATVTTSYGSCSATTTILQPDSMALKVSLLDPSCNEANGYIRVSAADEMETYTYQWNTNPVQTTDSIANLLPGTYQVTAENQHGCKINRSFDLVNTGLIISVNPVNPEILPTDSVQLTASGGITYSWSPTADLSCTDCASPYASPPMTTDYVVTGTNAAGCTGSATAKVIVWCPDVFIPTIFSPNADGQNDYLCKWGGCVAKMTFSIYNRWGQKVFETEDVNVCWDGSFKGRPAEPGAYVYKLKAVSTKGERILQSGNITLVR